MPIVRWPSKDPDDYMQPGRWETDPPRWVARLRGQPTPDPTPFWINLCASFGGFVAGGVIGEAVGSVALTGAGLGTILAQLAVAAGWRLKHRAQRRSS